MKSLNNIHMEVIESSPNGVINKHTTFIFSQTGNYVSATYRGGLIVKGVLVGYINKQHLHFSYSQLQKNKILDNGISKCSIEITDEKKIRIIENFEWKTRNGEIGTNILQEI